MRFWQGLSLPSHDLIGHCRRLSVSTTQNPRPQLVLTAPRPAPAGVRGPCHARREGTWVCPWCGLGGLFLAECSFLSGRVSVGIWCQQLRTSVPTNTAIWGGGSWYDHQEGTVGTFGPLCSHEKGAVKLGSLVGQCCVLEEREQGERRT
jgi:hypothetical protein